MREMREVKKNKLNQLNQLSLVSLLVLPLLISSCTLVPGMHMKNRGLSPTLNSQGQIVTPKVTEITPDLIKQEELTAQQAAQYSAINYQVPAGFVADTAGYQYKVGPQDVLNVVVWDHPNLNNPMNVSSQSMGGGLGGGMSAGASERGDSGITVDSDGNIYYPYVGVVHVGGLNTDQIRTLLTQKLSVYLKQPQLNVDVVGFNSQKIEITGAVARPSVIPVTNIPMSVLNAVTLAGGPLRCGSSTKLSESGGSAGVCADIRNVQVTHEGVTTTVNLDSLRAPNGNSTDWLLYDGDTVFIPNNNFYRIFMLGAVNNPGPYNMIDNTMSLREALGDAGGVSDVSDPTYTYVIRNYQGDPSIFELNARSPDVLNLAGEFALKPEDIVFISTSKLQNFNQIINQFLPSLSTAVYIKSLST